ncbi:MAG TPA: hypothetical protein VN862_03290 [Candidatus Acidoferrales bacterium]|nr:hypothetical protein [Candidatus Acidoferrales bacterium]
MIAPQTEYSQRLEARMQTFAAKEREHIRLGNSKLLVIVAGLVAAWLGLRDHKISLWWIAAAIVVYLALAILHERILRLRNRADRAAAFYRRGLARIADRWAGSGETGDTFGDDKHVYSGDLDLFGRGSLFELLSNARTPMGEARLASWLTTPSDVTVILARQEMVGDLREKLDLREHLAIVGAELRPRLEPKSLSAWAEMPPVLPLPALRIVWAVLAICAAGTFVLGIGWSAWWPLYVTLFVEFLILFWLRKRAESTIETTAANAEGLLLFAEILGRLEQENFSSPRLQSLLTTLKIAGSANDTASAAVRHLSRIVTWIDAREGLIAKLLELPMLYTLQVSYSAEAWRRHCGAQMRTWIDVTGEMEALLSLAAYAFEHPADPFPQFVAAQPGHALLHGEQLGHPLIPAATCIRNSARLDQETRVLLISGSNMSGKSTFLRTIGINAVLAMAGAPIRGASLVLTPLAVGTRLRTPDSLQEGRSGFYSEVLRIKQVFDLTKLHTPVLFLFDELLEGTNSKDRKIGAEGLIRALLERGAIGVLTTHDLALTAISMTLGSVIHNAHFQDYVEDGKMRFDYTLREGVVAKSNAIALMRLIGLDV